jgi:hypothetical protein
MTYTEAVTAVKAGKHAWRTTGTGWGPKSSVKQGSGGLVNSDNSAYKETAEDKAATNWEVGLTR